MAGTLTKISDRQPQGAGFVRHIYEWVSDADGDVNAINTAPIFGVLQNVIFDPDADDAPTDNYDVLLNDEFGVDVLNGLGANRDTANTEVVAPRLEQLVGATTELAHISVGGPLTPVVSNAGDSKKGRIIIDVQR